MSNLEKIELETYNHIKKTVNKICKEWHIDDQKIAIINHQKPHIIKDLSNNKMAIYTFNYKDKFLKIGKAYSSSNNRYKYHHYNPNSVSSNLAKSILADDTFCKENSIDETNIKEWMHNNLQRIDIIMDKDLEVFTLNLFESCLHYEYRPIYEGYKSQR